MEVGEKTLEIKWGLLHFAKLQDKASLPSGLLERGLLSEHNWWQDCGQLNTSDLARRTTYGTQIQNG
jgi:hypothetical protein